MGRRADWVLLAAIVLIHLGMSIAHGVAHAAAGVPTTAAMNVFIGLVIFAGPVAGLYLSRSRPVPGGWLVAATMAASLVFGAVNHFVIESSDHVAHVVGPWQPAFAASAVLLAITETAGTGAGAWFAMGRRSHI